MRGGFTQCKQFKGYFPKSITRSRRSGLRPIKFYSSNVANVGAVAFVPEVTIPIMNATFGTALYGFYAVSRAEAQFTILGQTRGSGETRRGLGDLTIVPVFLQWSFDEANLYVKFL